MSAPADGMAELREFALQAMALDAAAVSLHEGDGTESGSATVSYVGHDGGDTISAAPVIDIAESFDLRVVDVRADFDAESVAVEVRAR